MARISSGAVDMLVDSLLENYDAQMISGQGVVGCVPLLAYPIGEMRLQLEFRSLLRRLRVGDCHRFPPAHLPADLPPDLPPDSSGSSSGSGKSSFSQTFSPSDVVLEVPFYRTRSGRSDDLCADGGRTRLHGQRGRGVRYGVLRPGICDTEAERHLTSAPD